MHGNVSEWCQDWWAYTLPGGMAVDPQGPDSGSYRVFRGGHWDDWIDWEDARDCRSARRGQGNPGGRGGSHGFRVVLAATR